MRLTELLPTSSPRYSHLQQDSSALLDGVASGGGGKNAAAHTAPAAANHTAAPHDQQHHQQQPSPACAVNEKADDQQQTLAQWCCRWGTRSGVLCKARFSAPPPPPASRTAPPDGTTNTPPASLLWGNGSACIAVAAAVFSVSVLCVKVRAGAGSCREPDRRRRSFESHRYRSLKIAAHFRPPPSPPLSPPAPRRPRPNPRDHPLPIIPQLPHHATNRPRPRRRPHLRAPGQLPAAGRPWGDGVTRHGELLHSRGATAAGRRDDAVLHQPGGFGGAWEGRGVSCV
jgi:hypothetical protein